MPRAISIKKKEPLKVRDLLINSRKNLVFTAFSIDRSRAMPLHLQLYEEIRGAITSGRLQPGTQLPSSRALAKDLSVGRNTVINAFEQLLAEGYLEGKVGSGTYVTDPVADDKFWPGAIAERRERGRSQSSLLSARGRILTQVGSLFPAVTPKPFRHGLPALDEFPLQTWRKLSGRRLRDYPRVLLGYGDAAGYLPLREAIASYLASARAVYCEPEQIIMVTGSQQAIYLAALVLLDPGDFAWVEDPGYLGARGALVATGAQLVPIPVDEHGLSASLGVQVNARARLAYVTPSNQYPLGVTMSLARRLELLEWANRSDGWIIEDDYDSEFRYSSRPIAALQGLDKHGRVIYIGTFSKIMAPSLRLGYLVVPPDLIETFISATSLMNRTTSSNEQVILADFIREGYLARHVRRMRAIYLERLETLVDAVNCELGGALEVRAPDCGMHLIGWLPLGMDDVSASDVAREFGVETRPCSLYYLAAQPRPGLILGYGAYTRKQINAGVHRLAAALEKLR